MLNPKNNKIFSKNVLLKVVTYLNKSSCVYSSFFSINYKVHVKQSGIM